MNRDVNPTIHIKQENESYSDEMAPVSVDNHRQQYNMRGNFEAGMYDGSFAISGHNFHSNHFESMISPRDFVRTRSHWDSFMETYSEYPNKTFVRDHM